MDVDPAFVARTEAALNRKRGAAYGKWRLFCGGAVGESCQGGRREVHPLVARWVRYARHSFVSFAVCSFLVNVLFCECVDVPRALSLNGETLPT